MEDNGKMILKNQMKIVNKPNIFLDLDQTLINSVLLEKDSNSDDEYFDFRKYKEKAKLFHFENMDNYYIIFQRPHLQNFLEYIFENFNVSIWTAADKEYATFIIENIIIGNNPNRKLDYTFFKYHCYLSEKLKNGTKDLSMFWDIYKDKRYNSYNTFILDDYDEVYDTQPKNCIPAEEFFFTKKGSENDIFLYDLIPKLKIIKKNIAYVITIF